MEEKSFFLDITLHPHIVDIAVAPHNIFSYALLRKRKRRMLKSNDQGPPQTLEDYKAERRRQRWAYFLMPFFTVGSIVVSVAMLMFFGKACQDRIPADAPLRTSPLFKQYHQPQKQQGGQDSGRATDSFPAENRLPFSQKRAKESLTTRETSASTALSRLSTFYDRLFAQ